MTFSTIPRRVTGRPLMNFLGVGSVLPSASPGLTTTGDRTALHGVLPIPRLRMDSSDQPLLALRVPEDGHHFLQIRELESEERPATLQGIPNKARRIE